MSSSGEKSQFPLPDAARLSSVELSFIREIEKRNKQRLERLHRLRRNNRITGLSLGAGALAIYFYSMFAIKQETFLDDFEPPEKIIK